MKKQVQLERIIWKLKMAARRDAALQEFGANRHGYRMNEPIEAGKIESFEKKTGIALPAEFAEFLQTVGNGGAGPYYGILELDAGHPPGLMNRECRLAPDMTQEEWGELSAFMDDPSLDEPEKERLRSELYGGLLDIGTMGWTFEMMLVVTGTYRGRIVYIDRSHQIPFFTYEANFLEWYERWLDEIIGGYDTGWFEMEEARDELMLIDLYLSSLEEKVKVSAIRGMHKLLKLKQDTRAFLLEQCEDASPAVRMAALEILAQKDYAEAVPRLEQALVSSVAEERLNAARQIEAHGEPGGGNLAHVLSSLLPEETDARVLCQSARILEQGSVNPLHLLIPLFDCPDPDIRREAVFHAGRLPGRQAWAEAFGAALGDADGKVRRAALGALEGIPLPELLPRYERLLHDDEPDAEMRRMVLRRLDEYGERARTLLERLSADEDPEIGREARHKIERLKVKVNKS